MNNDPNSQGYNVGQNVYGNGGQTGQNGVYWRGTDGNVYVKGSSGVNSAGKYDNNTDKYWFDRGFYQIQDPYQSKLGASTNTGVQAGGGGGGAAYDPGDLAYLDSQQSELQRQLGRTDTGLRQALEKVLNEYNRETSSANTQRGRALEDFGVKEQTSEKGRERELGKVDTNARMLANSLRQRIGLASGSGSSAYQVAAPQAVQRQQSEGRGDVLEDYSANFQALDRDKKRANEDFDSLLKSLSEQRLAREGGVQADIAEQRNRINSNLAQVAAQRQQLLGGGYGAVRQAMQPYEDQIRQGESTLDSIFDKYTTKYDAKPVQVANTQLRDYAVDKTAIRDQQAGGTGNQNAYKVFADEEENANPLY